MLQNSAGCELVSWKRQFVKKEALNFQDRNVSLWAEGSGYFYAAYVFNIREHKCGVIEVRCWFKCGIPFSFPFSWSNWKNVFSNRGHDSEQKYFGWLNKGISRIYFLWNSAISRTLSNCSELRTVSEERLDKQYCHSSLLYTFPCSRTRTVRQTPFCTSFRE